MLWGPPFVAPIPVAAPNPLSLPDAAHLGAAGRHSFLPGGQRAGPLESKGRASTHKSRVHRLLCFRASSEADIIPRVDQALLWSSDPVQNSSLLGGTLPLCPVWDACSSFPAPPPFQKESTLSSWASFPGAEVSYSIFSLNEALLFWCEDLIASKVLLTPSMEANCAVRGNHVVLLSCWHGGRPHPVYLQGLLQPDLVTEKHRAPS